MREINGALIMEIRVLEYFLAVVREQSISAAAESLFLSQPTLSRQLKDLEEQLGKQLFIRGNRRIALTEEGMILRKRAEEIISLVQKAKDEISLADDAIAGDVTIGAGETDGIRYFAKAANALQKEYPLIHVHIVSGDKASVQEELDRGLIDFGVIFGEIDTSKYVSIVLPYRDRWGVLMRKDSSLAQKEAVTPNDLIDKPLILSRQLYQSKEYLNLFQHKQDSLNIVATCNLLFNGSLMVQEGMGYAPCLDKIINVSGDSDLCFRPFVPEIYASISIVWKKYQAHTKVAEKFIQKLQETVNL